MRKLEEVSQLRSELRDEALIICGELEHEKERESGEWASCIPDDYEQFKRTWSERYGRYWYIKKATGEV